MGTFYWCAEYGKVLLSYVLLMFVYPSVIFRSYLKGKGRVFWFCFCVSSQIVLISTTVLLLGLFGLLNVWVFRVLFYGSLIWSASRSVHMGMTPRYLIYKVNNRTYGVKLLLLKLREAVCGTLKRIGGFVRRMTKGNVIELAALTAIVLYGMIYFGYGAFREHCFGASDMYVHHSWIYGLQQGQSFSGGIYPEGMHTVIYALNALFGVRVYSILLYLQCIHVAVFLLSAYFLIRELFPWHYSGLLALAGFLTHNSNVSGMSRLQWTIPQEFGLYAVFTIPLFLVRYLKHAGPVARGGKQTKMFWSDDLVVFLLGIAATVSVHFYDTFMAIFACAGVAVALCRRLFCRRRLVPVLVSAVLAVVLAVAPMAIGLLKGIPFQGSIYWALGVVEGDGSTDAADPSQSEEAVEGLAPAWGVRSGIINQYGEKSGSVLLVFWLLCPAAWLLWRVFARRLKTALRRGTFPEELFDGYGATAMISVIFLMMLSSKELGIPTLIEGDRLSAVNHMFLMALPMIPVDLAGTLLTKYCKPWMMQGMGAAGAAAVIYFVMVFGNYHVSLFNVATRYPAAAEVSNSIIASIPKGQFTVVSTTDEYYQVVDYGFHEEYLTFLDNCREDSYYLPTPYVFFFVEKHPLQYAQNHYFSMPDWLALPLAEDYESGMSSVCPDMLHGEISDDKADDEIAISESRPSDVYSRLADREIVESAAARFVGILRSQYPNDVSVYYEDEDFVCYCLKQNPNRLIELRYPE